MRLEKVFSMHPYTGWSEAGLLLIECNNAASAKQHGAKFIRNNQVGVVRRVTNAAYPSQGPVKVTYVTPCLACRSLKHKTYSRHCKVKL